MATQELAQCLTAARHAQVQLQETSQREIGLREALERRPSSR